MLSGTDLSFAYAYDFDQTQKPVVETPVAKTVEKKVDIRKEEAPSMIPSMDPSFMTADQKLLLLTNQLAKQKELFEQSKGTSYFDKLVAKKKDVLKLVLFSLVIILALSLHSMVKHYLKQFFEDNVMTASKEFAIRLLYPALVLLVLWNIKAFNK